MTERVTRTRLNPCNDVDSWVTNFNEDLGKNVSCPQNEMFNTSQRFCDWRLSYGIHTTEGNAPLFFLSFYPPFCTAPKATYHYSNVAELATDVMTLENFLQGGNTGEDSGADAQDIIACAFAIIRDKESFELFQEQKDLMELGLKHFHLDNFYQDNIKKLCTEYYDKGTIYGKELKLSFFSNKEEV